ncbi:MAG: division/cell wall cluster transcriptional repressor MraZ [Pseudomonadota bacterium]|nr:division/cell wall cluster transcriptional repressor MraZ [Pseudomonadota bacterium]
MTSFISTFENKVDKKGRVSVPAAYRAALKNEQYQGVIGYPSLIDPAIEGFGRGILEQLNLRRFNHSIENGDFSTMLVGGSDNGLVETIMSLSSEMPFDGEGRIILPSRLADHAGIKDRAIFVGRGTRFQIWAPEEHAKQQLKEVTALRVSLSGGET